jgi:hypothetical protein
MIVVVIVAIVLVALVVGFALRQRTGRDGVDSFRRQIDALSPEARRPTIDQVKSAERTNDDDGQNRDDRDDHNDRGNDEGSESEGS